MITFTDIYDSVRNAVKTAYPSAYCTSSYNRVPPSFPCVWINEIDRYSPKGTVSLSNNEQVDYSTIEVQVFAKSNAELHGVMDVVNGSLRAKYYICDSRQSVSNEDETIYRLVGQYHRIIGGADEV